MIPLSRRELLQRCAAAGVLLGAPVFGRGFVDVLLAAEQAAKHPTPPNALGPFYRRGAPHSATLSQQGDAGLPLVISGAVYDPTGQARPDATIEVWHADHHGHPVTPGHRSQHQADGVRPEYQDRVQPVELGSPGPNRAPQGSDEGHRRP